MRALQNKIGRKRFLLVVFLAGATISFGQSKADEKPDKEAVVKTMVDNHRFVFKAQSAQPTRGRTVQLNSDYDVKVSGDTLRTYLPYFGRAYSAPIGGSGGGFDFTSKEFEYNSKARKKGGWDITIRPKDVADVREMSMTVFENGSASLRVTSNNREPMSFNGYIEIKD